MPSHGVRILVAAKPVARHWARTNGAQGSLRKGHDGLAALVQSARAADPFTGTVFVFRSKRAEPSGLVVACKRLEESTFTWPFAAASEAGTDGAHAGCSLGPMALQWRSNGSLRDGAMTLNRAQFEALFAGLDWRRVRSLEARRPAVAE